MLARIIDRLFWKTDKEKDKMKPGTVAYYAEQWRKAEVEEGEARNRYRQLIQEEEDLRREIERLQERLKQARFASKIVGEKLREKEKKTAEFAERWAEEKAKKDKADEESD